ncbi:hypothetical protein HYPSUDRAFT_696919 [Hypholoma sublateritium FD-334 SS-4]|uniref:Uncharacterized protein n=1 Tax=Hypholoma sublateritium (strain FD-334 SS-4) TaxID=945553 RepID=A0A0D2LKR1_HYPSF|nr:hypothetical protein HYPSUDRAFT_696919 [Hypholoma sublateritium FD-334 SS-4]
MSAEDRGHSPSPEHPPDERNYDDWFQPASSFPLPVFSTPQMPAPTAELMFGFTKASKKGIILPSKKALEIAAAKRMGWERDIPPDDLEENGLGSVAPLDTRGETDLPSSHPLAQSPMGVALKTASSTNEVLSPPSLATFSRPSLLVSPATPHNPHRPKPFKTPFLKQPHTPSNVSIGSPLNPQRPSSSFAFVSAANHPHPLAAPPINASTVMPNVASNIMTPFRKSSVFNGRTTPAPFRTPFRPGFKPPLLTPGNTSSFQIQKNTAIVNNHMISKATPRGIPSRKQFFCLSRVFHISFRF